MRRRMVFTFLFLAGCIFISSNAIAGWTQAKGHSYNQLTFSYYKTVDKYTTIERYPLEGDAKGENAGKVKETDSPIYREPQEKFTSTNITYYGEFGLHDDLTLIFSVPFASIKSNDIYAYGSNESVTGVGDIIVGLRQKISNNIGGNIIMSVQGDIKIPEAYDYGDPMLEQSLGEGQYDATFKLKFGRGFNWGYSVLDIGYKWRGENDEHDPLTFKPSDQFLVSFGGGYAVNSWLSIRGNIDWAKSIGDAEVSNELVTYAACCGVDEKDGEKVLIKDGLGLEQDSMSGGVALAFNVMPKMQVVLSYNQTLSGFGDFKTENSGIGKTGAVAFVYTH